MAKTLTDAFRLNQLGEAQAALDICRDVLGKEPRNELAWMLVADIAIQHQQFDLAIAALTQLLRIDRLNPSIMSNLGAAYGRSGQLREAVYWLERAASLQPSHAEAQSNLSAALRDVGEYERAARAARLAIELKPNWSIAYTHLANALAELELFEEANRAYRQALDADPNDALAHKNYGLNLLRQGELRLGFDEYEWRWQADAISISAHVLAKPMWTGGTPVEGRRILLCGEQGLGDQIQFSRYVGQLQKRGAHVVLQTAESLIELFRGSSLGAELYSLQDAPPDFDEYCPLMSLPNALGIHDVNDIPHTPPYLRPAADRLKYWQPQIARVPGLKIGIAWEGNLQTHAGRTRTIPLQSLAPLADLPNLHMVSLQKGARAQQQIAACGFSDKIIDLSNSIDHGNSAFLDSAAIIQLLDLVICCDTSIAHLSAALGQHTWILLRNAADWRWFTHRTDSPWYPTVKLFRKSADQGWEVPIRQIISHLSK